MGWKRKWISGPPAGTSSPTLSPGSRPSSSESLEKRTAQLEGQAKSKGSRRMPGLKPKQDGKPAQPKKPRQARRQGFARTRMTPTHRAGILERVRGSPVVHADETGWREDGNNGCVWTFSTPTQRYFLRRGRGKTLVDEVLGAEFAGVLANGMYRILADVTRR